MTRKCERGWTSCIKGAYRNRSELIGFHRPTLVSEASVARARMRRQRAVPRSPSLSRALSHLTQWKFATQGEWGGHGVREKEKERERTREGGREIVRLCESSWLNHCEWSSQRKPITNDAACVIHWVEEKVSVSRAAQWCGSTPGAPLVRFDPVCEVRSPDTSMPRPREEETWYKDGGFVRAWCKTVVTSGCAARWTG